MIVVDGYPIDAALVEDYNYASEVTDNPVERGSPTTDHINNLPPVLTFDCVVSDHPLGEVARMRAAMVGVFVPGQTTSGVLPSQDAFQKMIELRDAKEPFVVECSLGIFDEMVIGQLGIPRKVDDGEALRFRITFRRMTFATNERTTVKVAVPKAAKKLNKGNKPADTKKPPKKADENASILWKLIN